MDGMNFRIRIKRKTSNKDAEVYHPHSKYRPNHVKLNLMVLLEDLIWSTTHCQVPCYVSRESMLWVAWKVRVLDQCWVSSQNTLHKPGARVWKKKSNKEQSSLTSPAPWISEPTFYVSKFQITSALLSDFGIWHKMPTGHVFQTPETHWANEE